MHRALGKQAYHLGRSTRRATGWGASGTLTVKVCSLETGSPGSVRVLVYASGHATLSCDSNSSTNSPTAATVGSPTAALVVVGGCQDSPSKFAWNGKENNCKFVSRKSDNRCSKDAVAKFCPVTCQKSQCTCNNTAGRFQMANGKQKSCKWATQKSSLKEKRCNQNVICSSCPIACGVCKI